MTAELEKVHENYLWTLLTLEKIRLYLTFILEVLCRAQNLTEK